VQVVHVYVNPYNENNMLNILNDIKDDTKEDYTEEDDEEEDDEEEKEHERKLCFIIHLGMIIILVSIIIFTW
jgi:uncharacterized protein YqhQ